MQYRTKITNSTTADRMMAENLTYTVRNTSHSKINPTKGVPEEEKGRREGNRDK